MSGNILTRSWGRKLTNPATKSTFALRMQPEVFNKASIWSKVCHTLYRIMHNVRNTQVKGGSEWSKQQKNRILKRCRMRLSTLKYSAGIGSYS